MARRMDGWTDGRMDGWTDGWMDGWTDGRWTDGWMDGQTDRRTDRRTDGLPEFSTGPAMPDPSMPPVGRVTPKTAIQPFIG
jgi:hypothetical protein